MVNLNVNFQYIIYFCKIIEVCVIFLFYSLSDNDFLGLFDIDYLK